MKIAFKCHKFFKVSSTLSFWMEYSFFPGEYLIQKDLAIFHVGENKSGTFVL